MRQGILLDTHIFIWSRVAPGKLTAEERQVIDAATLRYVSAATFWEIGILVSLGRIENDPRLFDIPKGVKLLPIEPRHCAVLSDLPQIHRDPFDRMLVAQARSEDIELLTRDEKVKSYFP